MLYCIFDEKYKYRVYWYNFGINICKDINKLNHIYHEKFYL